MKPSALSYLWGHGDGCCSLSSSGKTTSVPVVTGKAASVQEFVEGGAEQKKDMAGTAHILPTLHSSGPCVWEGRNLDWNREQWGKRGHEGHSCMGRLLVGGTQPTAWMGLDGL